MGNFVADLIRERAQQETGQEIDIGLTNNGGLRVPLFKGKITIGNIYELMPFDNEIVTLQLTGKQIKEFVGQIVCLGGEPLSGIKIIYKKITEAEEKKYSKNGVQIVQCKSSSRQTNYLVITIMINNRPVELDKKYTLATSDYLATGGNRFSSLKKIDNQTTNCSIRTAITDKIKALTKMNLAVTGDIEGRVFELN